MTTIHLVVSVRGMLNWTTAETKRNLKSITKSDGTRYTSVNEFRNELMDELARGHEVLPTGACDRHDFKKGCLGMSLKQGILLQLIPLTCIALLSEGDPSWKCALRGVLIGMVFIIGVFTKWPQK